MPELYIENMEARHHRRPDSPTRSIDTRQQDNVEDSNLTNGYNTVPLK